TVRDLVEREELRRAAERDVAAAAAEAGDADALRNVLLVVPAIEVLAPLVGDVVPDRDDAGAGKRHGAALLSRRPMLPIARRTCRCRTRSPACRSRCPGIAS